MRVMLFAGCEVLSLSVVWVKATADDHGSVKSIRWLCLFIVLLFVDLVLFCCCLKHQTKSLKAEVASFFFIWHGFVLLYCPNMLFSVVFCSSLNFLPLLQSLDIC